MFLIMSGAYVSQELQSEFGKIPPSFLPLGNRRLFQHQVNSVPEGKKIFISLPEHFIIESHDRSWLEEHHVSVLRVPEGLTLGASLVASLNLAEYDNNPPLSILFGDTLLPSLPLDENIISISKVEDSYRWAVVDDSQNSWLNTSDGRLELDQHDVVCGYFNFNQPRQLLKALTMAHWDFIESLNFYHEKCGLSSVEVHDWLDCGHINTYYRSKAKFTTQRSFNNLEITPHWIRKSSYKTAKIAAEANWFEQVPAHLRVFLPQYLGSKIEKQSASYQLEYLHYTALNEILNACLSFIEQCQLHEAPSQTKALDFKILFDQKTNDRLNEYCQSIGCELDTVWSFNGQFDASFEDLLSCSNQFLPAPSMKQNVVHGDFCFSNILYDFRTDNIKTFDPRGLDLHDEFTIFGDSYYDVAKLSHSLLGLYDWIIAGYYDVQINDRDISFKVGDSESIKGIQTLFLTLINDKFQLSSNALYAMQIHLFLSMLPLHADDEKRQQALMANAFRLYQIIKEG